MNRAYALRVRQRCRELRKGQTEAENLLWRALRNRGFCGLKFTRQHPLFVEHGREQRYYIADFYCHAKTLVLELDGTVHERTADRDQSRDELIGTLGLRVMRISNDEVASDLPRVLGRLRSCLEGDSPL